MREGNPGLKHGKTCMGERRVGEAQLLGVEDKDIRLVEVLDSTEFLEVQLKR